MRTALVLAMFTGCGGLSTLDGGLPDDELVTAPDAGPSFDGGAAMSDAGSRDAGAPQPSVDAGQRRYANPVFSLPDAGDAGAMTCDWLDGDNCWKRQVQQLSDCLPDAGVGTFVDSWTCSFPTGQVMEFSSPLPEPRDAGSFWIASFRLRVSPGGRACFETAYGLGKSRFTANGTSVHVRNTSLLDYEVVCPDTSSFSNQADAGTCGSFGLRYLIGGTPGHFITCDDEACVIAFTGMPEGRRVAARCRR